MVKNSCLFAIKQIKTGDEIDYNYGDSNWPWREKVCIDYFVKIIIYFSFLFPKTTLSVNARM